MTTPLFSVVNQDFFFLYLLCTKILLHLCHFPHTPRSDSPAFCHFFSDPPVDNLVTPAVFSASNKCHT